MNEIKEVLIDILNNNNAYKQEFKEILDQSPVRTYGERNIHAVHYDFEITEIVINTFLNLNIAEITTELQKEQLDRIYERVVDTRNHIIIYITSHFYSGMGEKAPQQINLYHNLHNLTDKMMSNIEKINLVYKELGLLDKVPSNIEVLDIRSFSEVMEHFPFITQPI